MSSHPGWAASNVEERSQRKDSREQGEKIYQGWEWGRCISNHLLRKATQKGQSIALLSSSDVGVEGICLRAMANEHTGPVLQHTDLGAPPRELLLLWFEYELSSIGLCI